MHEKGKQVENIGSIPIAATTKIKGKVAEWFKHAAVNRAIQVRFLAFPLKKHGLLEESDRPCLTVYEEILGLNPR